MTRKSLPPPQKTALALALALASPALYAQETPSLEEMWEMIQAQQDQIEALQDQNAALLRQV
ncbi:MAG: hypothetical protein V2I57_15540, partial [Xanthomonadales bacterium]|nr:hypothetical protein [Xanthomonadales bacterium]